MISPRLKPKVSDEVISASNQIVKDLYHPNSTSEDVKPADRPRNLLICFSLGILSRTEHGLFTTHSDRYKFLFLKKNYQEGC